MTLTDSYQRTFDFHDGSHYQPAAGPFNVSELARGSSIQDGFGPVVSWKSTQSTSYVDPTMATLRDTFNDLFEAVVWYHWISSTTDINRQVDHALDTLGALRPHERLSLDGEEWDRAAEDADPGVTERRYLQYLEGVEAETQEPCVVYSGLYVAYGRIWKSLAIRNSRFGPRPTHLAAYVSRQNLLDRLAQQGAIDLPMHLWQYSSNGPAPGVTGRADLNHVCDWSVFGDILPPTPPDPDPGANLMRGTIVTNSQKRISEFDGQEYETRKFVFVCEEGGTLRHVDGAMPEASLFPDPAADDDIKAFTNADLDRWPKYVAPTSGGGSGPVVCPPFPIYTGQLGSVPGEIVLTPQA